MFGKFSAAPKVRAVPGQMQGAGPAHVNDGAHEKTRDGKFTPLTKRRKVARACDRCRLHRLRCDEQKPCAPCVGVGEECIASHAQPHPFQASINHNDPVICESVSGVPPRSPLPSPHEGISHHGDVLHQSNSPVPVYLASSMEQESSRMTGAPSANVSIEHFSLAHVQGFFAIDQTSASDNPSNGGCHFPQLPHPAIPSRGSLAVSNTLPKSRHSYYLWVFWNFCHPLLQIMTKLEFSDLETTLPSAVTEISTVKSALVNSMVALGILHSHATGRTGRVLGLQEPHTLRAIWPGFEYFHSSREAMRNTSEVNLDVLRCHILLVIYLMKGNAILDAYNLIGIAARKAYVIKLHRQPPNDCSEDVKTARMQVWWMLFTLDLQCALQLEMPPAIQKNLVQCPFPTEHDLARYVSSSTDSEEGTKGYICSNLFVNLIVLLTHVNGCVSETAMPNNDPVAFDQYANTVSSALQTLDAWREKVPQELSLCQCTQSSDDREGFSFTRALLLPEWLLRRAILLELHYHNAYILIQRPFIRLRSSYQTNLRGTTEAPECRTTHVELHVSGVLHHATSIIDMLFAICSMSDVLYGWSETLQPLWNATQTIMAHVATKSTSPLLPTIRVSLTHANDLFKLFSPTCATASTAQSIIQSLISSLYSEKTQISPAANHDEPMDWHLFSSLFEGQAFSSGAGSTPEMNVIQGDGSFAN